jgi:hypothetical protein
MPAFAREPVASCVQLTTLGRPNPNNGRKLVAGETKEIPGYFELEPGL